MKTILTYGTFDLFHLGHVRLLKRLKSLGDKVIVGLSTDEFNLVKGKSVVIPYEDRREILLSCKYVDHVFAENNWEQKRKDIKKFNCDIFAMGDDWTGKFNDLGDIIEVVYLPRTADISTTSLKVVLQRFDEEKISEIKNVMNHLNALIGDLSSKLQ